MSMRLVCLLVLALHAVDAASLDKSSQHLRQPSYKEEPAKEKKNVPAVVKVENEVREHHQNVMDSVDVFRAEVCAKMKVDYGKHFDTFEACHKFMVEACKPGRDTSMNGEKQEVPTGKGYCKEYFPEREFKVAEKVEKEVKAAAPAPGPFPGPGPAPAPAPKAAVEEKAPAPAPKAAEEKAAAPATAGAAPAPGPMGGPSPAPGPVPAPFIPGISPGKPYGAIADDEAWYYKKDGKSIESRMHMSEGQKLPTHGYWGKLVEHEDMETATGDWQAEFGPKSGYGTVADACRKHPDSPWCKRKGFGSKSACKGFFGRRNGVGCSSCAPAFAHVVPLLIMLFASSMFQ